LYLCRGFNQKPILIMKNSLSIVAFGGILALASCASGPTPEEQAAAEQARLDSIKAIEQFRLDSMAQAAAEAEAAAYAAGQAAAAAAASKGGKTTTTTTTTTTTPVEEKKETGKLNVTGKEEGVKEGKLDVKGTDGGTTKEGKLKVK
jgi:hypothetical protein